MTSIYDQQLDKNDANFVALSPVSFVERSAEVFGDLPAVVHGRRRYNWAQTRERSARLAAALRALGVGRYGTVSVMLHNTPGDGRSALRRAGAERRAQHAEHAARRAAAGLADESLRGCRADHRPRVRTDDARGAAHPEERARSRAGGDRRLRQRIHRRRRIAGDFRVRGAARRARPAAGAHRAAGRVGRHRGELHLGHHGRPEGRRHPPPRRVPECGVQRGHLDHAALSEVPVDAADVPLQRLVLPVDGGDARPAPTCACAASLPPPSSRPCASTGSTTTARRRSCTTC